MGTVFISLAGKSGTVVECKLNRFSREKFKETTAKQALNLLMKHLIDKALCA